MDGMAPATIWGMGLVCVLVIVFLALAAAALVKYLTSGSKVRGD